MSVPPLAADIKTYDADHNRVMRVIRPEQGDAPLMPHTMREFTAFVRGAHTESGTRGETAKPIVLEVLFRYSGGAGVAAAAEDSATGDAASKKQPNGVSSSPAPQQVGVGVGVRGDICICE